MGKQCYYVSLPLQILQNDFPMSGRRFSSSDSSRAWSRNRPRRSPAGELALVGSSKGTEVSSHTHGPELARLALAGSYVSTLFQKVSWEFSTHRALAAAAKSLQSCPTVQPHRRQPTRLPCPWDSPSKSTRVGCHFLLHQSTWFIPNFKIFFPSKYEER